MTYFPVQPRYSVYVDSLGDPLDDGYIYLGKANLDPTVYPAKASWDEAGLYPITFPVRTMNGYPLRDGIPAQMYLNFADNTEYSVLINDEDGVEVFSSTTGLIGYFPSTGAGGDADTLEGHPASYFAVDSLAAHLAGAETFTGAKTFDAATTVANDLYVLPLSSSITNTEASLIVEESDTFSQGLAIAINNAGTLFSSRATVFLGTANSSSRFILSAGSRVTNDPSGALWATPNTSTGAFFVANSGTFSFYSDSGLTADVAYTPTEIAALSSAGNLQFDGTLTVGGASGTINGNAIYTSATSSASDTFTTADAKTVTVVNGLITSIV